MGADSEISWWVRDEYTGSEVETALRHFGADLAEPPLVFVAGKRQFDHLCSMLCWTNGCEARSPLKRCAMTAIGQGKHVNRS